MSKFRPMLAAEADFSTLRFPLYVTPKLDGVRALVLKEGVVSRSLKPIPNLGIQELIHTPQSIRDPTIGMDGELIAGDPTAPDAYRKTQSICATADAPSEDVRFYVFDNWSLTMGYKDRINRNWTILREIGNKRLVFLEAVCCKNMDGLVELEERYLDRGYEGLILRDPNGPYKHGRSTAKEQWMLKLKRFVDSEAEIIGIEEEMENTNEAKISALGLTERSSHKANLRGKGRMGALIVRDLKTRVEFKIGTGFTAEDRVYFYTRWHNKEFTRYRTIVKYKHFPSGGKDKPRFPSYQGLRDAWDL